MLPALAHVSSLPAALETELDDYAAGQCDAVEIWFSKIEGWIEQYSLAALKELLAKHDLKTPVAAGQGGLIASQGDARREAWELFRRRLALGRELGVTTVVVAADIPAPQSQQDLDRVQVSLRQLAQEAGQGGLRVALEFQARAGFANNLQTAAALVGEVGSPHLGICFDSFHYAIGPSKLADLAYLSTHNLFHVQLADYADVPRELAADRDRILPGEGDVGLDPIVEHLRRIGYAGHVSIELLNPQLWQVPTRQFAEIAMTSLRRALGLAKME